MVLFKTIVILDIETTGLPHLEHRLTKITEISLVACMTSHCQGGEIPRVVNKLTLALNPMKMIMPQTAQITGLENELLEEMKTFDDNVVSILNGFLGRLPQPICLIAHNGLKFDFPILMKHLMKCKTKLIDNIHCADSLPAFRAILQNGRNMKNYKCMGQSKISGSANSIKYSDTQSTKRRTSIETTPERRSVQYNAHPVKPLVRFVRAEHSNVSRKLNFDDEIQTNNSYSNCDNISLNSILDEVEDYDCSIIYESQINQRILHSYKLIDIYEYLHGGHTPKFHRSEEDCMALLSCINKCKDNFLNWLYDNAILLSDVKPLF